MMAESNNPRKSYSAYIPNDLLNDLSSRFIINVPEEERVDLIRLCFQIELAHWFYLDFYCEDDTKLPKVALKDFIKIIFGHVPFLQKFGPQEVDGVITDWREYKKAVPTFGAILLDEELKNVLLVQSYVYRASWSFPKGKVNKDEFPHHCAIREVLEETGFDISDLIDKDEYLEHYFNEQLIRLYIITGVPADAKFCPTTRNEIKGCEWFPVSQLPTQKKDQSKPNVNAKHFFLVLPFVKQLKKWISTKNSYFNHLGYEKAYEIDRHTIKHQQAVYGQMTKADYARYTENSSPAETRLSRQQHKSTYSPPPRMLRQQSLKHSRDTEKKKNTVQSDDRVPTHSKHHKKIAGESSRYEINSPGSKKTFLTTEDGFCPVSKTWLNFSLDCEALVATFNINLRKTASASTYSFS